MSSSDIDIGGLAVADQTPQHGTPHLGSIERSILDESPHGVLSFRYDSDAFVCCYANDAALQHFPDASDCVIPDGWPTVSRQAISTLCREAYENGQSVAQLVIADERRTVWLDADGKRSGDRVHVFLTDLSPLGRAVDDFVELDSLFRHSHDLLCVIGPDAKPTRINPSFRRLLGHDEATVLDSKFSDLVHPDDRGLAIEQLDLSVRSARVREFEARFLCFDGSVRWLAWVLVPHLHKVYAVARDLSEQKLMEEEMLHRRERFDLAVAGSSGGLWHWDVRSDHVWRSRRFHEMLGYDEFEGMPSLIEAWEIRLHPLDHGPVQEALHAHLNRGEAYDVEYRIRTKSGAYKWVRSRGESVRDDQGQPMRMAGSIADIDAQKRVEHALARAKAAAEAASRAKSNFLANMSHEIRTPMTAILGYTDLLADSGLDDDTRREHLNTIRRNGDHLLELINDILDLSKIEANRIGVESIEMSIADLVADLLSTMGVRASSKGIPLEVAFATSIPDRIVSDPLRVRQILVNLVGNAVKFTERGSVRIVLAYDQLPNEAPRIQVRIEDSGIGMTAEQLGRLFQPFSQADASTTRRYGGTGLGLTISKSLANMLGGDIRVTSRIGVGSTFDLMLPVTVAHDAVFIHDLEAPVRTPDAKRRATPKLKGRVLVAEDGPDNQRLISHVLRMAGLSVEIAENGQEALDLVGTDPGFDLVLMDMQMPVMDGYDATRKLRANGCELPVIALTAHAMSGDRTKCLEAGCTAYATKPVKRVALLELLSQHLDAAESDATQD